MASIYSKGQEKQIKRGNKKAPANAEGPQLFLE